MTRPCYLNRKRRRPWASVSAAAFSACSTWTSSANDWSREYGLTLITTAPSVIYHVYCTDGTMVEVDNPALMPDMTKIDHIEEPFVKTTIIIPKEMVGTVMEISQNRRGQYETMDYLDETRVSLVYNLPLCEILYDYFDVLKSATRGYASLDYELNGYQSSPMVKMDILINGEVVDALSVIVHREFAARRGRALVESCAASFRASCSRSPFRPRWATRSLPGKTSRPCARTYWPSATAAILRVSASCWKSRKKGRSA